MRSALIALAAALMLASCGDAPEFSGELSEAKQGIASLGREALQGAASAIDTRTACTISGQSPAFCACIATRLGDRITPAHVEAFSQVISQTVAGAPVEASGGDEAHRATRQAVIACATTAAIQGVVGEAGE